MMAVEYPGMARLATARIPVGDNSPRVTESMLSLLKAGGVSDQAAAYAADPISMYATAIGYEQSLYATLYDDPEHQAREVERVSERFSSLSPERFPTMASLKHEMTRGDGEERFSLGLDVIVNGLLATPAAGRLTRGFAEEDEVPGGAAVAGRPAARHDQGEEREEVVGVGRPVSVAAFDAPLGAARGRGEVRVFTVAEAPKADR
jgi:Tetracyclin repressor-like, C-terminal domain